MNNSDYIARHIADTAGATPQMVYNSGYERNIPQVEDAGTPFVPMSMAVEQGQKAIVAHVKAEEKQKSILEAEGRLAQAVADAMREPQAKVGKLRPEAPSPVATLLPPEGRSKTAPEPREALQAGIKNVGVGGRKGVYSETGFEPEDVPDDWEVFETYDGGFMASPKENVEEVIANEKEGSRHKTLGMTSEKKDSHDTVVQVRDVEGVAFHEETTDPVGLDSALTNALSISKQINGSVDIVRPEDVLSEREARSAPKPVISGGHYEISDDVLGSIAGITQFEEHPEGYVSPMTLTPEGTVGKAQANRDGMAYPYMFHVNGKGWEVDVGYGGLIKDSLSKEEAMELVKTTPPITLQEAKQKSQSHIKKDLEYVKSKYPSLAPQRQGLLAMMRYQGGDGLDVSKWTNTNKYIKKAMKTGSTADWKKVQRAMLDSKWATMQTPERALRLIHAMHPSTRLSELTAIQQAFTKVRLKNAEIKLASTAGVRG